MKKIVSRICCALALILSLSLTISPVYAASSENQIFRSSRSQPISVYEIDTIEGYDATTNAYVIEDLSGSPYIDSQTFNTSHTFNKNKEITLVIHQVGTNGSIYTYHPGCSYTSYGAPFAVQKDAYGGLVEWKTNNRLTITDKSLSTLNIRFTITTSYSNGNIRMIYRTYKIRIA